MLPVLQKTYAYDPVRLSAVLPDPAEPSVVKGRRKHHEYCRNRRVLQPLLLWKDFSAVYELLPPGIQTKFLVFQIHTANKKQHNLFTVHNRTGGLLHSEPPRWLAFPSFHLLFCIYGFCTVGNYPKPGKLTHFFQDKKQRCVSQINRRTDLCIWLTL